MAIILIISKTVPSLRRVVVLKKTLNVYQELGANYSQLSPVSLAPLIVASLQSVKFYTS